MTFAIVSMVVLLVIVTGVRRRLVTQRSRTKELAAWASSNGWYFKEGNGVLWRDRVPSLGAFVVRRMASRTVDDFPVTIANAEYTRTRFVTRVQDLVVLWARLPGPCPEIRVEARGPASNVLRAVHLKDRPSIATGNAEFDQRFATRNAGKYTADIVRMAGLISE